MMKNNIVIILSLLLSTIMFCTGCALPVANITGNDIIDKNTTLIVQSNVTMDESNINSMIAGKIKEISVEKGDEVKKGDVIAIIDSDAILAQKSAAEATIQTVTAQISAVKSAKDVAEAKLRDTQNGTREEQLKMLEDAYNITQINYDRTKTLFDAGAATQADLDKVELALNNAKNQLELSKNGATEETIKALQAQVDQADSGIKAAEGQLKQAQASLQGIEVSLGYTTIEAPADGIVTSVSVSEGDLVSSGLPIAVVTQTGDPSITCNLKEINLNQVELGQEVEVRLPAFEDKKFKAKVTKINKNADFATKRATNDNGDFDILSFEVEVKFEEIENEDINLRAGMTAFVDFGK